eukprot:1331141-Pleurochrysis_carterae.AAC.1
MRQAWQALAPFYYAPAIYCRASPLVLQLAGVTTTVVRKASYSPTTRLHREDRGIAPSGSRCRHALGINSTKNTKEPRNGA